MGYGRVLSRRSKIISVNRNKSQLLKNAGVYWNPNIAIQGDPASFLVDLSNALKGYKGSSEWIETLRKKDDEKEAINRFELELN